MNHFATLLAGLLLAVSASAGDVYVTTDAQGHKVYTDAPQTVPARKLDIRVPGTDAAAAGKETSAATRRSVAPGTADAAARAEQPATQATAEDRAARCAEARQQSQALMNSLRVYRLGPNGEPIFLSIEEMSAARVNAKQVMDRYCTTDQ